MTTRITIKNPSINAGHSVIVKLMSNPDTVSFKQEVCPGQEGDFHVYAGQYMIVEEVPVEIDSEPVAPVAPLIDELVPTEPEKTQEAIVEQITADPQTGAEPEFNQQPEPDLNPVPEQADPVQEQSPADTDTAAE